MQHKLDNLTTLKIRYLTLARKPLKGTKKILITDLKFTQLSVINMKKSLLIVLNVYD
jgi:hypothetical protein